MIRNANIITGLKGNLPMRKIYLPKIGARIIKSGVAVLLCFLIYQINCRSGILFYIALAALQCMQPDRISSKSIAKQRICGTFIGALYGLLTILLQYKFLLPLQLPYACYCAVVALCVMASLYTAVVLKLQSAAYFPVWCTSASPWYISETKILACL